MRALVIDDSKAMRTILKRILSECGAEVAEACDGQDGLKALTEKGPFDVALVDWNMPIMNGYEFVVAVRADESRNGMKIMMVTTETDLDNMARILRAGANEYVMKPFTKEMIIEKMNLLGLVGS